MAEFPGLCRKLLPQFRSVFTKVLVPPRNFRSAGHELDQLKF